ncbi:MAG TPA: nicotinate-nucleotide adenylyltransferase [Gemmatimonadaceae bacterium]
MRIGLLGGSFDPPHNGHLLAADDAFDALRLDRLLWIPTATQPLKIGNGVTPAEHRLSMVQRLVEDDPRFAVDSIEIERGGLSYTVDTLAALTGRFGASELFLLIGADVLPSFPKWREPARIAELATLVVMRRSGDTADVSEMPANTMVLQTRRIDVSSTEIRERVREGKSIRGFVPDAVARYIAAERLYR